MIISQAQQELNTLRQQFEAAIDDYHQRTGLVVDVQVSHLDVTEFGSTRRRVVHSVVMVAAIKDGGG